MTFTAQVNNLEELSQGQRQFLLGNGFRTGWFQCLCGSCDPEECLRREFASEEEADEFLWNEEGEFNF